MKVRTSARAARRVIPLFLALILVPSLLLAGLGWKLFEQDRINAVRQISDRRSQTADLAVSMLEQALAATEKSLRTIELLPVAADATAVVIQRGRVILVKGAPLAYRPGPPSGVEVPSDAFQLADSWHYQGQRDRAQAVYRSLSASTDRAVRAGALFRIARGLREAERIQQFARLAPYDDVRMENVPVSLLASIAQCSLLESLKRTSELRELATKVREDLLNGRWALDRRVYETNLSDVTNWSAAAALEQPTSAEILAGAVDEWWSSGSDLRAAGRRLMGGSSMLTLLWQSNGDRRVLFVALPSFVEREWLSKTAALVGRQNAFMTIRESASRSDQSGEEIRSAATTGLPWTVVVADRDAATEMGRLDGRRSLWLGGLAALVMLLGAGAYLVTRSISRELAIARLQSDFVGAVSHEFRTPLTSMRQLTEILVDERVTDEERRRSYFRALARQTERLHRLVEGLLDFGRLEAGTSPYRLEALDACALVRTVAEEFARESASQEVRIDLDISGDAWQVAGDRDALTNAFWNLLDNAVKYSPACRTVWVTVAREADRLLVRVRDNGIGIPEDEQRAIFNKFVRGAQAKDEGFRGTGIGLAMVRHIVRGHGGEIRVESTPGGGSTFTVALPLAS